jgi:hypothetical protein
MPRPQPQDNLGHIVCEFGLLPIVKQRALKQLAECLVPPDAPLEIYVDDDPYEDIASGEYCAKDEAYDITCNGPWEEIEVTIVVEDGDYGYALEHIDDFRARLKTNQSWKNIPHGVELLTKTEYAEIDYDA